MAPTDISMRWERIAGAVYFALYLMILTSVVDYVSNTYPMNPGEATWRYGALGILGGFLPTPLFAAVLILLLGSALYQRGQKGGEARQRVTIRHSGARLAGLGVGTIDILKVDTEGHEREILLGLDPEMLERTRYITGELHGERDFELLDWLEQRGYRIGCRKSARNVLFNFEALRAARKD